MASRGAEMEPERLFSFTCTTTPLTLSHADIFKEPTTLVEFRLERIEAGTSNLSTEIGL